MSITAGINTIEDIHALIEYPHVSEFFCGVVGSEADGLYGHRPNTTQYNFSSIEDLKLAIGIAHSYGRKIFLVLNEVWSNYHQMDRLSDRVKTFDDLGFDAFIMNDISLLILCKKISVSTRIHLSSLALCLNSFSIGFYKKIGNISRIILPHQITADEFRQINSIVPNLETEIFFQLYNNCAYIDGLCRYHGSSTETFCRTNRAMSMPCLGMNEVGAMDEKMAEYCKKAQSLLLQPPLIDYAGNLFHFNQLGTEHVKLGTRGISLENKIKLIRFVDEMVSILEKSDGVDEYRKMSKELFKKHNNILLLPT